MHVQSTAGAGGALSDAKKGVYANIGFSWSYVALRLKFHNWADGQKFRMKSFNNSESCLESRGSDLGLEVIICFQANVEKRKLNC